MVCECAYKCAGGTKEKQGFVKKKKKKNPRIFPGQIYRDTERSSLRNYSDQLPLPIANLCRCSRQI